MKNGSVPDTNRTMDVRRLLGFLCFAVSAICLSWELPSLHFIDTRAAPNVQRDGGGGWGSGGSGEHWGGFGGYPYGPAPSNPLLPALAVAAALAAARPPAPAPAAVPMSDPDGGFQGQDPAPAPAPPASASQLAAINPLLLAFMVPMFTPTFNNYAGSGSGEFDGD